MPKKTLDIIDESGDKKYFTIIPNYILNHSTANDQALYLQMKRISGDNEICFASKRHFMKQLGIGIKAVNKSLDYLVSHKWIKKAGVKKVQTKGGIQEIQCYKVLDLWEKNINYYKGVVKRTPPNKQGGLESNEEVVLKVNQGGLESTPKKNTEEEHIKKNTITKVIEGKPYGDEDINWIIKEFETIMGFKSSGTKDRFMAKHLFRNFSREQLQAMMKFCADYKYSPNVGSIEKLWYKRGDIIAGIKKLQNKGNNKVIKI